MKARLEVLPVAHDGHEAHEQVAAAAAPRAYLFLRRRLLNSLVLGAGDVVALVAAQFGGALLLRLLTGQDVAPRGLQFLLPLWLFGATLQRLLPGWGLGAPDEVKRVTQLLALTFGIAALAQWASLPMAGRVALGTAFVLAWVLVLAARQQLKRLLIRLDLWGVPTVVYGGAKTGGLVVQALRTNRGYGYWPVGVFDDDPALEGGVVEGVPILGPTSATTRAAPVAVVAMPGVERARLLALMEGPLASYTKVIVIPDLFGVPTLWAASLDLGGVLGLAITRNLLNPFASGMKRAVDLLLVLLTAPAWCIACALVAALIWLEDRASPLFVQERVGLHGRRFRTYKFRTMLPDAEAVLQRRLHEDAELRAEWEANFKLRRDPRVTRVGAFLRRTSLDELPQILNILRGDMSLVGPRPLPEYHLRELSPEVRRLRAQVRPGLTGLWQVSGRSDAGNAGMEQWDPYYVRNWSAWLDIVILVRTVRVVLHGTGAY